MKKHSLVAIFATMVVLIPVSSATVYHLTLMLNKPAYGPGERIEVYGTLLSGSTPVSGANVTLFVGGTSYKLNTTSDGVFYSRSSYYPSATLVSAPSTLGDYNVTASYSGTNSSVAITVVPLTVDNIVLDTDHGSYYAGQAISLRIESKSGETPVANVSVNGSIKTSEDATVSGSAFSCTTDANGACTAVLTAPSTSGQYSLQTTDGLGYAIFWVNPFDVAIAIRESTATTDNYVFKRGNSGYVNIVVTYNSTLPTGAYTTTGTIKDVNGTTVYTLGSANLNSTNSYTSNLLFSVTSSFATGNYRAAITVARSGGETMTKYSSYFEVRDWTLSVDKTTANSGFEYGYTAFPNKTLSFEAMPIDKSTSNTITGLESSFNISLKNNFGVEVTNATPIYNTTCSCYKFNFTAPSTTGTYTLSVSVYYNETQRMDKVITVADTTASALTTDIAGTRRVAYTSEYIYIKPTLANMSNSSFEPSDAEVISVIYDNGTVYSYTNVSNWTVVNLSNSVHEWSWNSTSKMIKMDAPGIGGLYMVEIYANNRSYRAVTKFIKKQYLVRASFKNSEDVSVTSDYWWQFKTTDTAYAHLAIVETDVTTLQNLSATNGSSGGMWGVGSAPTLNSNTENAVANATITMKVYHAETGKEELLNTTSSACKSTTTTGKYICTMKPNSTWTGGGHRVVFSVVSQDGKTQDRGEAYFEARAFYLYGWPQNWRNKPNSSVMFNINAYVAGSGWWSARSSGGVDGTISLERIEYMGTGNYWMRTPVTYDYNTTGMNATALSGGQGTLTLAATRASGNLWKSGSYTAVVKVTETSSGTVDYGRVWFEVRNWDVWAQPVELAGGNIQYRWEFNNYENVSLYVIINNAGEWGSSGQSLGGNVTVSVKSITNYMKWPPTEMNLTDYRSTAITVNQTNAYFWGSAISGETYGKYIINISPSDGTWDSGYYTVLMDVNGTESGYAWFSAIAFYVSVQSVDENGTSTYTTKGRGPLYFDIETTKNNRWGSSYSASDYVNTTIKELVLRRWDPVTYQQIEYKYPTDLNVSVINVSTLSINGSKTNNGTNRINITLRTLGNWSSGYYNGEIVLEDVNGSKGTGWLWIEIKPFRVHFGYANSWSSPTVGMTENLTGLLSAYEPSWYSWTLLSGNYSIESITQEEWSMGGRTLTYLSNYTPASNTTFINSTNLTVQPNTGEWTGMYTWKSLKPTVNDNSQNVSEVGYIGFRVIPAMVRISTTSSYEIATSSNVTINVTIVNPSNTSRGSALNLTEITEWIWNPSTSYMSSYVSYNFSIGSCHSATVGTRGCMINSTLSNSSAYPVTVTIVPPRDGWSDGYHYPYAMFSRTDVTTSYNQWDVCDWNTVGCNINFRAMESMRGYMYSLNWRNAQTSNVTMYVYSLQYINGSTATVNVSSVKYAKHSGSCWSDSCRVYSNANFYVTDYNGVPTGSSQISGSGYITLTKPAANWETGEYYTKIAIQAGGYSATIKDGNFRVADTNPPNVTMLTPTVGQTINASTAGSLVISSSTTENARCDLHIRNYDSYYSIYCGQSNSSTNTCNNVTYNGSTYHYAYVPYSCYGSICVSTGGTSHSYTYPTSSFSSNQNYSAVFGCYDDDWNYATNATVFGVVGANTAVSIGSVTLTYPPNATRINTTYVNFSWQAASNASNYTFQMANSSSFGFAYETNQTNTTAANITIYGLLNGTIYYWRVRGFSGAMLGNWSEINQFKNFTVGW